MAVNLIVLAVTLLMAGFVGVWIFFPRLRAWMEMPKYRFLEQQRQFPSVCRDSRPEREDRCQGDKVRVVRSPEGSQWDSPGHRSGSSPDAGFKP